MKLLWLCFKIERHLANGKQKHRIDNSVQTRINTEVSID
jgi:hypothetical protein